MSDKRYRHVVRAVMESAWPILPGHLEVIREIVEMRAAGEQFTREEIEARVGSRAPRQVSSSGAVAVIPIAGVIVPRATLFSDISGGTSVESFQNDFLSAMADEDVGSIVLDVNSPGGVADLLTELATTMREARGTKPVLAVANTMAASAAYWIASQADEVAVTPSGMAGSIGVYAAHEDLSAMQEKVGVKMTLISAGKHKTEGNPYEPLSEDALAHIQSLVDATYDDFTNDVALGRGVSVEQVRNGFGEGRVLDAKRAVDAGIADRVATLEQTIGRAAQLAGAGASSGAAAARGYRVYPIAKYGPIGADGHDKIDLEAAGGDVSLIEGIETVLCAADDLIEHGRPLTKAKRDRFEALRGRLDEILAKPAATSSELDVDAELMLLGLSDDGRE